MARNEEKQLTRLNRIHLQQLREDEEKRNPKRPNLCELETANDIKRWIPSIKNDIEFNLKQSQVTCYPDSKIAEFNANIKHLEFQYKLFIKKLKKLDPACSEVPWTERPYLKKAKEDCGETSKSSELGAVSKQTDVCKSEDLTQLTTQRISLPILQSPIEAQYQKEKLENQAQMPTVDIGAFNENHEMNQALQFQPQSLSKQNKLPSNVTSRLKNALHDKRERQLAKRQRQYIFHEKKQQICLSEPGSTLSNQQLAINYVGNQCSMPSSEQKETPKLMPSWHKESAHLNVQSNQQVSGPSPKPNILGLDYCISDEEP